MEKLYTLTKTCILAGLLLLASHIPSSAFSHTAITNGNWSDSTTWGEAAPGFNIAGEDTINIHAGITVTLDSDLTLNDSLTEFTVDGTLDGNYALTLSTGTLSGTGIISIHALLVGSSATFAFSGNTTVKLFESSNDLLILTGNLTPDSLLVLDSGVLQLVTGDTLILGDRVTLNMAGASFAANGGNVFVTGSYNLVYSGTASTMGMEISFFNLQDITLDLPAVSDQLMLSSDLNVPGTLFLKQGILNLKGYSLTLNNGIITSPTASLHGSLSSIVTIQGKADGGTLGFDSSGYSLGALILNIDSGSVSLTSKLLVESTIALHSGTLNVGNNTLIAIGRINSAGGYLGTTINSSVAVCGSANMGILMLPSGIVGNLTLNITSGFVSLGSDVMVNGLLKLTGGTLRLNGFNLAVNGKVTTGIGTAYIAGNSHSDLTLNDSANGSNVVLDASADTLRNLTVNIYNQAGSISFGSDVHVMQMLSLTNGMLDISNHNLYIEGTVSTSSMAMLNTNAATNITILGSGNVGNLALNPAMQGLGNFIMNASSNGFLSMSSGLTVNSLLSLSNGKIDIGNNTLTIATGGTIQGDTSASYIITNDSGDLAMIVDTGNVTTMFTIGTAADYSPVKITNHADAPGVFKVNAHTGVPENGSSGTDLSLSAGVVNTSWNISSDLSTPQIDLEVFWNSTMEVNGFLNLAAYISRYGQWWDTTTVGAATLNPNNLLSLKRNNISGAGQFAVFNLNTVTAIHQPTVSAAPLLYPNPAGDELHLFLNTPAEQNDLIMTDVFGKEVFSSSSSNMPSILNVSHLAPGIYFISVNGSPRSRFIKS